MSKLKIDYFYRTSARKWTLLDAIENYDDAEGLKELSFVELLEKIKNDLLTVQKSHPNYFIPAQVKLDELDRLLNLRSIHPLVGLIHTEARPRASLTRRR